MIVVAALAWGHGTLAASATFTSAPAHPAGSIATATLAAPTGLSTGCFLLTPTSVRLNWTITSSTWADGYEVLVSSASGGPYSFVATVSGRATNSTTVTRPNTSTYYYVVRATKFQWRSANSNQAATPGLCVL